MPEKRVSDSGVSGGEIMVIRRALKEDADVIGEVHSDAWRQTYQGIFSQEYLDSDSPASRRGEFLRSLDDQDCVYMLLEEDGQAAGIVKLVRNGDEVEIASIYILEEYRGRGFGRKVLEFILSEYNDLRFVFWYWRQTITRVLFMRSAVLN